MKSRIDPNQGQNQAWALDYPVDLSDILPTQASYRNVAVRVIERVIETLIYSIIYKL